MPLSDQRTHTLKLRLKPEEASRLAKQAAAMRLSDSDYIRLKLGLSMTLVAVAPGERAAPRRRPRPARSRTAASPVVASQPHVEPAPPSDDSQPAPALASFFGPR